MEIMISLRTTADLKKERDGLVARLHMINNELKKREEEVDKEGTSSEEPRPSDLQEPKANEGGGEGDVIARSRLSQDLKMQEILGKGAFGLVRKAEGRLDGILYAIKMVSIGDEEMEKVTKELKVLAELNHENVVRYYASWIEKFAVLDQDDSSGTVTSTGLTTTEPGSVLESESENSGDRDKNKSSSDGVDLLCKGSDETTGSSTAPVLQEMLCIQMEFCAKTLREVIDSGLYKDDLRVWRLFREAVQGMAYCHEKGILHRDLKPENIFVNADDHVKIGDFGLATKSLYAASAAACYGRVPFEQHTSHVGTHSYMSPEMISGSERILYSNKVDIFSMGVVFFEMCFRPLGPSMERAKIIENLRKRDIHFPEDFYKRYSDPTLAIKDQESMICWMLDHDPSRRPSFIDILQLSSVPSNDIEHARYNLSLAQLAAVVCSRQPNHPAWREVTSIVGKLSESRITLEWFGNQFIVKHEYMTLTRF